MFLSTQSFHNFSRVALSIPRRWSVCLATALLVLLGPARSASAANTLAAWDVHALPGGANNFGPSPLAATTTDPHLTVGGLTRGSGVSTSGTGAARAWGGSAFTAASHDAAITSNQF